MYAIVDIETTGNGCKGSKITEISIFMHDGEKVVDELVNKALSKKDRKLLKKIGMDNLFEDHVRINM